MGAVWRVQGVQSGGHQQCLQQVGTLGVPMGIFTVGVHGQGCARGSPALPPPGPRPLHPPEEGHLVAVQAGAELQSRVVPEGRHHEAEGQRQAHEEGGQHDLQDQRQRPPRPRARRAAPSLIPLFHPWLPAHVVSGRWRPQRAGQTPAAPHLREQAAVAAVGQQEALKQHSRQLLAGQCPALHLAPAVQLCAPQGLCLWGAPGCGEWGHWSVLTWGGRGTRRGHKAGEGCLTQLPVLQGWLLWEDPEPCGPVWVRNTCVRVLPAAAICGATKDQGQKLMFSPGAGSGSGGMDDRDQKPGMEPGARLMQEWGLRAKPGPSLDQS